MVRIRPPLKSATNASSSGFPRPWRQEDLARMMEQETRIIIAGGGPAGIFAALSAAQLPDDILILDGNIKLCRKLSATGNGRCNITNRHISFEKYHGRTISL